jgi:hypothetical protein
MVLIQKKDKSISTGAPKMPFKTRPARISGSGPKLVHHRQAQKRPGAHWNPKKSRRSHAGPYAVGSYRERRHRAVIIHKYRGCIVVLSINKRVEPNEEQKVLTSGFDQGFTVNTSKWVFRSIC